MPYRGHVQNGVVVLDEDVRLGEGTEVLVQILLGDTKPKREELSDFERLKDVIGKAEGLPEDFAENHDHYIHGVPKK